MSLFGDNSELKKKAETLLLEKKELIAEKLGPHLQKANEKVQDFWQNEEEMRSVFGLVYDSLPLPIRLICKREVFVEFCIGRSDDIKFVYELINSKESS